MNIAINIPDNINPNDIIIQNDIKENSISKSFLHLFLEWQEQHLLIFLPIYTVQKNNKNRRGIIKTERNSIINLRQQFNFL